MLIFSACSLFFHALFYLEVLLKADYRPPPLRLGISVCLACEQALVFGFHITTTFLVQLPITPSAATYGKKLTPDMIVVKTLKSLENASVRQNLIHA